MSNIIPQEMADKVISNVIARFPKKLRPKLRLSCEDAFTAFAACLAFNGDVPNVNKSVIYPISSGGAMYTCHPEWHSDGVNLTLSVIIEAGRAIHTVPLELPATTATS